ncbi:MAG: ribulose-phosphate 3-epimerase [Aquificota bacterium]|jgi:ribulose-phosphate 3-epimerase|nr:ribulose-phosphate 3-epimerase [Aquificaceae bacterium]MDM7266880.1 ribulose-phosphate 3-epimerase [Aquificaceae bacterium]QWK13091.1 MAG: ribulose-phosphate 3-epimerase [Aquificota bacterium]HAV39839.1 ribulose-phosphate 3-epimerase [Aquificaceae bacterium]
MKLLAPSILSADFWRLGEQIQECIEGGADIIHFDVMDGHFVPNITFGPVLLESIKKHCPLPLDAHLMIENPDRYIPDFIKAGADMVSVHVENTPHLHRTIDLIKSLGAKAGVVINPATPLSSLEEIIYYVDFVLLMSVNPGFGGQKFIDRSLIKLRRLKAMVESMNPNVLIEVDGGIKEDNILEVARAGADIFVVGSGIFGTKDIKAQTKKLKEIIISSEAL